MNAKSQFNINDRGWILEKSTLNKLILTEVIIEGISIDFSIDNQGELRPNVEYYVRKKTDKFLDDDFLNEEDIFANLEDLTAKMEMKFGTRQINFPKVYSLTEAKFNDAA
jgi:hypothetical protein